VKKGGEASGGREKECGKSAGRRLAYLREKVGRASEDVMFLQAEFMCMSASRPDSGR
jgi:hypothetical protein